MENNPFFLVGVGRSGTTLLRLMFHNHPNIAIPYESHFITKYYDTLDTYGDLKESDNLNRLVQDILNEELLKEWDHEFKHDQIIQNVTEPSLSSVMNSVFSDYANAKGKVRWGDKSDYLDRMHQILKVFPKAKFIHIIRDGRDVANSVMKLDWGPNDILGAAEWWSDHVSVARAIGTVLGQDRYAEVKYEDLVNSPIVELGRLCEFLNEPFVESMLEYHKSPGSEIPESRKFQHYNSNQPPKSSRTYAWKAEMNKTHQALFNDYASKTLMDLGYEVPNIPISRFKLRLRKVIIYVMRIFSSK